MSKEVKVVGLNPQLLNDSPEQAGRVLAEMIGPEDFAVVIVGTTEERKTFADLNLWHYRDEEEPNAAR